MLTMIYEQKCTGYEIKNIASRRSARSWLSTRCSAYKFLRISYFWGMLYLQAGTICCRTDRNSSGVCHGLYTGMKNCVNVERMTKRKGTQCTLVLSIKQTTIVENWICFFRPLGDLHLLVSLFFMISLCPTYL